MAWQSPSGQDGGNMAGGNGIGGVLNGSNQNQGAHGGNGGQTAGTEYTLQGVMRFLQTEWHRHERDRNSWEIERADMKARIAKMEGDNRAAKMMQQAYLTRVKMLESALKKEREKNKATSPSTAGENAAEKDEKYGGFLSNDFDGSMLNAPLQSEAGRAKSKFYLEKCLQEITYLLTPPPHPPQQPQMKQDTSPSQKVPQNHLPAQDFIWLQSQARQALIPQHGPPPSHQPPPRAPISVDNPLHQMRSAIPDSQQQHHAPLASNATSTQQDRPSDISGYIEGNDGNRLTAPPAKPVQSENAARISSEAPVDDAWDFDDSGKKSAESENLVEGNFQTAESTVPPQQPTSMGSHSRRTSLSRKENIQPGISGHAARSSEQSNFKVRFALRGHLDVIRAVVFTGGGTATEPEVCTAGDDGVLKRWIIPGGYNAPAGSDLDVQSHFTHRGHAGIITSLAACPTADSDGWIFSGGQDSTVKVWERGRVDAKATLEGHTDTVWSVCVLPTSSTVPTDTSPGNILIASGSADGTVKVWSVTAPRSPSRSVLQLRKKGRRSLSEDWDFSYVLISTIIRPEHGPSPTCINLLSITGTNFIVSYDNAQVVVYDTANGEELVQMTSQETYDGTKATGVNWVVASTLGLENCGNDEEETVSGPTGRKEGIEGVVFSGHEDGYIRFYDANSGQCTYTMLAHPSAVACLSLSPDGRELVSAGHDASLRFWSLEKRSCTQEITTHRLMRGEGVCSVVWSPDGRWVISGGGDGVAKVLSR